MRRLIVLLVCLVPAMAFAAEPALHETFAPGPDGKLANWSFSATRGVACGALDTTEPAGGQSVRLETSDPTARATYTYVPRITLKPGTCYRLSVKVLRIGVRPGGRAYVILYEDGVEGPTHWHMTPSLTGTQDWQTISFVFRTRPETSWARLQCKLWDSPGLAWFDDLVIEETPSDAVTPTGSQRPLPPDDGSPLQLMWYPAQRRADNTLHLLPLHLNSLAMFMWGKQEQLTAPRLIIETPVEIRLTGPIGVSRGPVPEPLALQPEAIVRGGVKRSLWRVPVPVEPLKGRLKPNGPEWTLYHFLYATVGIGCPSAFTWRWQIENGGAGGPWHEIPARLEPLDARKLTRVPSFPLYAQHTDGLLLATKELRREMLDTLDEAGLEGGLSVSNYQPQQAWLDRELQEQGFRTWTWVWDGYSRRGDSQFPLVYDSGKTDAAKVCPQAQVERLEPWWEKTRELYRDRLARGHDLLINNFEPPVFNCCFCERCRKAFAAHAKRPEAEVLAATPQQLQQLPEHAWGRFRAWQNACIIRNHAAAIREINPKVTFGLCGPPHSEWTADRGMDIRQFEPDVAFHAPMIYEVGTDFAGPIRSTCEGVGAPVIPFVLASDLAVPGVFPTADQLRVSLLATAASGGKGAVLWVGIESLDGEYLNALRRALREIALLVPYIEGGKRIEGLKLQPLRQQVRVVKVGERAYEVTPANSDLGAWQWAWESPRGRMAMLVNYDEREPLRLKLGIPAAGLRGLFGPQPQREDEQATLTLQPGEVAAVAW